MGYRRRKTPEPASAKRLVIPEGYVPLLDIRKTERAIPEIKGFFQDRLSENLNLERTSAPLFVQAGTGVNDDLNGVERKVSFRAKCGRVDLEIVNSLAKWKRMALARHGHKHGEGIWTDMNAIRPDEDLDNTHSNYVDQWDWERVIAPQERNKEFLEWIVRRIYDAIWKTERMVFQKYDIAQVLPPDIHFVTSGELQKEMPELTPKEREDRIAGQKRAVFVMEIGWPLEDGVRHDGRAPDYDDWKLNGDILVWNPVLKSAFELSSMGIRVDDRSLFEQCMRTDQMQRLTLKFHRMVMENRLPLSIGGGIGQSRLSMFLLRKAHIGEVQASIWPDEMLAELDRAGIALL
ncbi:MAG: aspartate--ammonia ligase [Candidatus Micrarchaeota archaeon]